jgi:carnosine N-methyltransferase
MENNNMDDNTDDEQLEREHFRRIVNAFRFYKGHSLQRVYRTEKYLKSLPEPHIRLLDNYAKHLDKVRLAIEHNYEIIKVIVRDVAHMFENVDHSDESDQNPIARASVMDMDKVQSTIKQFVRDWSSEGAEERKACYQPIIDEIEQRFPLTACLPRDVHILVPGAGLGRLALEIARRGYTCQGNEFSLFMLFASNFVLNRCKGVNLYRLYPFVHQYTNNYSSSDQVRYIMFPDLDPSELPPNTQFSMAAGDFMEVYQEPDSWHCVATSFFIDTATNIVAYIETIWKILKPGGYWINLGPLLYHFADLPGEDSIEPSYEDVRFVIEKTGFQIVKEQTDVKTTYAQNPYSMLKYEYNSVFFVCHKPAGHTDTAML